MSQPTYPPGDMIHEQPEWFQDTVVRDPGLDWVKFDAQLARDGSVPPVQKALYAALASYADVDSRITPEQYRPPSRPELAACIGASVDTVDRAMRGLVDRGYVRVHARKHPSNPRVHLSNVYQLLDARRWAERQLERVTAMEAQLQAPF